MNTVEPIRDPRKISAIKNMLRGVNQPRDYLLFVLGINVALRITDLLSLRSSDVYHPDGSVKPALYLRERKTGKENKIALSPNAREVLEYYRDQVHPQPNDYLFIGTRPDKPLSRFQAWRLIQSWCESVGLASGRYGTHTLRKTWGYQARKYHGVALELIQAKFNHSSPSETKRYIGISEDEVSETEEKVNL